MFPLIFHVDVFASTFKALMRATKCATAFAAIWTTFFDSIETKKYHSKYQTIVQELEVNNSKARANLALTKVFRLIIIHFFKTIT